MDFTLSSSEPNINFDQIRMEINQLRASVDVLVRLQQIRVGNVSFDGLRRLKTEWFKPTGAWPWQAEGWPPTGAFRNTATGLVMVLPDDLALAESRFDFIHALKLMIAHDEQAQVVSSHETVEGRIRAAISTLMDTDGITRVGLLTAISPDRPQDAVANAAV